MASSSISTLLLFLILLAVLYLIYKTSEPNPTSLGQLFSYPFPATSTDWTRAISPYSFELPWLTPSVEPTDVIAPSTTISGYSPYAGFPNGTYTYAEAPISTYTLPLISPGPFASFSAIREYLIEKKSTANGVPFTDTMNAALSEFAPRDWQRTKDGWLTIDGRVLISFDNGSKSWNIRELPPNFPTMATPRNPVATQPSLHLNPQNPTMNRSS